MSTLPSNNIIILIIIIIIIINNINCVSCGNIIMYCNLFVYIIIQNNYVYWNSSRQISNLQSNREVFMFCVNQHKNQSIYGTTLGSIYMYIVLLYVLINQSINGTTLASTCIYMYIVLLYVLINQSIYGTTLASTCIYMYIVLLINQSIYGTTLTSIQTRQKQGFYHNT